MENVKLIKFRLLNCGWAKHESNWNFKDVSSPFARLHIILKGEGYIYIGDQTHKLSPGSIYLTPPFTLHSYSCDDIFELHYLHIYESSHLTFRHLEEYELPFSLPARDMEYSIVERIIELNPTKELLFYDPKKYDTLSNRDINQLSQALALGAEQRTNMLLNTLIQPFLIQGQPKQQIQDIRIKEVIDYIRTNIYAPITVDELCDLSHISQNHLIRLMRQYTNSSPVEFINRRKIETAQLLLTTRDIAIKEVAYLLSFETISYFNKIFKRYCGKTPKEFRSQEIK